MFVNQNDKIQLKQSKGMDTIPFEKSLSFIEANPFVKLSYKKVEINTNFLYFGVLFDWIQ